MEAAWFSRHALLRRGFRKNNLRAVATVAYLAAPFFPETTFPEGFYG
jgi:hypothetical protein